MSTKTWEVLKTCHCQHIDQQVSLEAQVVYPADFLPDPAPRRPGSPLLAGHGMQPGRSGELPVGWYEPGN